MMKKYLYFLISLMLLFCPKNSFSQWQQTNGPFGGYISCMAISGTNIFAGSYWGGIFFSNNNGSTWQAINNGLTNKDVGAIVIRGTDIFAATLGGVFLSSNNGVSWTAMNNGLTSLAARAIVISGANIFVGTTSGVFLSTNNGNSWTPINNGLTNQSVTAMATDGSNIFLGNIDGVFLSNNNGSSWVQINNGLTTTNVSSLAINGTNIYAGTSGGGIFFSNNNGSSWAGINNGLTNLSVGSLVINGTKIFASTYGGGVFLSNNNGISWTALNNGLSFLGVPSLATDGTNIFAGTSGYGVYFSNNNGTSWVEKNQGLILPQIRSLAVSGANLISGTSVSGIYISNNNGNTWTPSGLTYKTVQTLAVSGSNVLAGTTEGIFLSSNNGNSWVSVNSGLTNQTVNSILVDGTNIFAGTSGGVFLSNNNGSSWTSINNGLSNLYVRSLIKSGTNIFAGTFGGVFCSNNNGSSWNQVNAGLTDTTIVALTNNGINIFAGTETSGAFFSNDNGSSWSAINNGLTSLDVYKLTSDGTNVYASAVGSGVFLSTNNGNNWVPFNNGLTDFEIYSLMYDGSRLFAGTRSEGVWISPISLVPISIITDPSSQSVVTPNSVEFTVEISGNSPVFNWQQLPPSGVWTNIVPNANISWTSGISSSVLTINNTSGLNNYQYRCEVSNSIPSLTTSLPATLTVSAGCLNVAIVSDPINQNISVPNTATFSVSVSGTSPTYVWQSLPPGGSWSSLTNGGNNTWTTTGNTSTLTISNSAARDNYQYRCIVSNSCPSSVPSNSATLTLIIPTINSLICTNVLPNPPVPQPQNYTFYNDNTPYSNNQPIKVCADGSSATYFKVNVSNTSLVSFKILDEFGIEATDVEKYGELGSVNVFGNDVEVNYTHPQIMGATGMFQPCSLQILFNGNAVTGVNFPISIYRAPIVFIHGFFGDENTFESLSNDLLSDVLYPLFPNSPLINIVNYHSTSLDHFYTNKRIVQGGIDEEFRKARNGNFSAGKVILIGHSMGGVLSRLYLQSTYANCFYRNDIQKLITVNTPHYGTQFANWSIDNLPLLLDLIDIFYGPNVGTDGAIVDMCVDSYSTKYELNIPVGLQNKVPSSTISSDARLDFSDSARIFRLIFNQSIFNGEVNDLVVPLRSQQGGILTNTTVTQQWHIGSCDNQNIKTQIRNLIDSSPYSNAFSQGGFPNFIIPPPAFLKSKELPFSRVSSIDTIKIISPNSGQLYNPNDIVPVNIFSGGNLTRMALIIYGNSISPITIDTINVSQIDFQIPATAIGELTLLLLGGDTVNWSVQDTVHIMVSSTIIADSVVAHPDTSTLALGLFKQIQINGYFNGSSTGINLLGLNDLIINYDSTQLHYDGNGSFQGLDTGNAVVIFNYQTQSDTCIIQIYNDPLALTAGFNYSNSEACSNNTILFTDRSQGLATNYEWQFPGGIPSTSNLRNPSVSYTTEGQYSVSLKTFFINGVDSITIDSLINIHGLPAIEITGDSVICFGDSIRLSASPGYFDYLWSTNSTDSSIIVLASGNYSVFITDTNSCSNTAFKNVQVISIDTSVTQNGALLSANSSGNYQWIYCDSIQISGETNQTFLPTQDGSYAVIITNYGCVDTSGCYLEIINDVKLFPNERNILIYPNPSFGFVTISINQNIQDGVCQIFDATGRLVYTSKFENDNKIFTQLEFELKPGMYSVLIKDRNISLRKKLIVE